MRTAEGLCDKVDSDDHGRGKANSRGGGGTEERAEGEEREAG